MRLSSWSSLSSFTALAVGLTEDGCCAPAGGTNEISPTSVNAAKTSRRRATSLVMPVPPLLLSPLPVHGRGCTALHRDLLAVRGLPAPGAGAVAALHHPLPVRSVEHTSELQSR